MAIQVPPSGGKPPKIIPTIAPRGVGPRSRRQSIHGAPHLEQHDLDQELLDQSTMLALLADKVRQLNRKPPGEWTADDYRELERLAEKLLAQAEALGQHDPNNPFARQLLVEQAKTQLRMLLQTLQPPPELLDAFTFLWAKARGSADFDGSSYAKKTLMNQRVRRDVMNQKMEEAVDEADTKAALRRVEALTRDGGKPGGGHESADEAPDPKQTLKHSLRLLKKKRRTVAIAEAEDAAGKALDVLRMLREEVAPRWAPETQPWLLQTADTHVFQTVLAVIPDELFRETAAYQGMQDLRAGEHAFTSRARQRFLDGVARRPT
jgi:hypothetical protein